MLWAAAPTHAGVTMEEMQLLICDEDHKIALSAEAKARSTSRSRSATLHYWKYSNPSSLSPPFSTKTAPQRSQV
jgi:hypothetical protein